MFSPVASADVWEIALFAMPRFRCVVQECGQFRSEGEAVAVGAAVRLWLQLSVWSEDVLGPVLAANEDVEYPDADRAMLLALPQTLRAQGIDPARVVVTAKRADDPETRHAGAVSADLWRTDSGHEGEGPHAVVTYDVGGES